MSNACPEDPSFFRPLNRPTGLQAILVTGPRGGFSAPTTTAAGGWQHQQRACHSQTETGRLKQSWKEEGSSSSLTAAATNPPPPLLSHHHWKLSRELRRVTTAAAQS